jgi:uncharacterized membrane protein
MKKWRLIAGIVLVFVVGVLAGAGGAYFYREHHEEQFRKDPAARRAYILKGLTRELRLTGKQQQELQEIIAEIDEKRRTLFKKSRAEVHKIFDEGFSRVNEKLNPEQRQLLKELRARHEEDVKEGRKRPYFR